MGTGIKGEVSLAVLPLLCGLLGCAGPAELGDTFTFTRERHVEVDGKVADAVVSRVPKGEGRIHRGQGPELLAFRIQPLENRVDTTRFRPLARSDMAIQVVQRTGNALASVLEHMRVNHGRGDVVVA